jgi:hypothetical protein
MKIKKDQKWFYDCTHLLPCDTARRNWKERIVSRQTFGSIIFQTVQNLHNVFRQTERKRRLNLMYYVFDPFYQGQANF